ncbi:phasin family protein [Microvirga brassicacearum]|uniref:phasin family protein n=1 Tax=Microvirga brassicacearum TaxID=2580413 RepID=UPI00139167B8|nr:phasin family protein [Microvirga brassicacearum]
MTTNKKFSKTPPDKANELITKLLATSDNAARTRERLLSELKEELELLASLQEQHLFPVLRKHGMQVLVQEASDDNLETSALIAELERMPKNNGKFLTKVAELRKVFQQHLRDDKKELLPAVLKVLSDEEAEAVVEKVEDEVASMEETKRAEPEHAQEQVEIVQQIAVDMTDTVRAGAEGAQSVARTVQDAVQNGLSSASELAHLSTEQAMQLFFYTARTRDPQAVGDQTSQNLRAVSQSGTILARGVQDVSRKWFELSEKRLQTNIEGLSSLARCRSVPDFVAVQTSLIRENLEQTIDNSRQIAEVTRQLADEAIRTVTVQAKKTVEHASRAA